MGICSSNLSSSSEIITAKLILENGQLEEFLHPIKVSQALKRNPSYFICKADDMNYDEYISATGSDEELELGHLYFVLPVNWLSRLLKPQEMAALAVKASFALNMSKGNGRRRIWRKSKRVEPLVYYNTTKSMESEDLAEKSEGISKASHSLSVIME